MKLGSRHLLTVNREAPPGLFLDGGERGEILLPRRYIPIGTQPGAVLDVFVYRDSEDRLVATTEIPLVQTDEFALLRVLSVRPSIGAFLDWGLQKDLLLPRREQTGPVNVGDLIPVRAIIDEKSDRVIASARINRWLDLTPPTFTPQQPVRLLITNETPLGYNAIVEGTHWGLLYHTDLAAPLLLGSTPVGFIRAIRPDGKIDLSLDRAGYQRVKPLSEQILQALAANGGTLAIHDKTPPEQIRTQFGVSKKAFKQALGTLYRNRQISLSPTHISLAKN